MPLITQGKTNIKYILIVIILAVIAGGGILGYYYLWIKDLETRLAIVEIKLPQKIEDETTNWEIYEDDEYKFSFRYPSNFKIDITTQDIFKMLELNDGASTLRVYAGQFEIPLPDFQCDQDENFNFAGFETLRSTCNSITDPSLHLIYLGGRVGPEYDVAPVVMEYTFRDPQSVITFDQILSTFKFLD